MQNRFAVALTIIVSSVMTQELSAQKSPEAKTVVAASLDDTVPGSPPLPTGPIIEIMALDADGRWIAYSRYGRGNGGRGVFIGRVNQEQERLIDKDGWGSHGLQMDRRLLSFGVATWFCTTSVPGRARKSSALGSRPIAI